MIAAFNNMNSSSNTNNKKQYVIQDLPAYGHFTSL
jgi:hypothetical protein